MSSDFFLRIAGQRRDPITRTTESGRVRIGQFGIGFLAMFPFCKTVEIESTVAGSPLVFVARIPASQFCRSMESESQDVTATEIRGEEYEDRKLRAKHYTRITLLETTELLQKYMEQRQDQTKYRNSIRSYSGYGAFEVGTAGHSSNSVLQKTLSWHHYVDPNPVDFNVMLNGEILIANNFVEASPSLF